MRPLVSHVTVGVKDLEVALRTWRDEFGFEIIARRDGPDATLGALWGIEPARIRRQALLGTPGLPKARVHLVEFDRPDPPVRGAASTDLGPKNLDVACRDLPKRYDALLQKGQKFRSPWVEYPFEGKQVREVQMPGHDHTKIVPDLASVLEAARGHGSRVQTHGVIDAIYGKGRAATVFAPSGLRVELMERP